MQKTASENIVSSGSYEFFLNLAHNTNIQILYSNDTRANSNRSISNTTLGTFFEKTMHGRDPKIGSYVPLVSFNNLKSGIF